MKDYRCRVCSAQMSSPYSRLGYEWATCRHCRSVQKVLTEAEFHALEPSYDPGNLFPDDATEAVIREHLGVEEKTRILRRFRASRPQKFLDIGCGAGGYLLAARDLGFEASGIEPSQSHSSVARSTLNLRVTTGYFDADTTADEFDVVMLSHVIEHIHDPAKFLTDVFRVVAPGGALIVVTPNVESLSAAITGKYWSMLKPVDHVTMLGKRSMAICKPPTAVVEAIYTHEWPGEFAAHLVSAGKQWAKPSISNVATVGRPKVTAQKQTISTAVRAVLALLSFPFYLLGSAVDRRSCLTAVFRKP